MGSISDALDRRPGRRWFVTFEHAPRDCWVGFYWRRKQPRDGVLAESPCRAALDFTGGLTCALWVGHEGRHRPPSPEATAENIARWCSYQAERLDVWVSIVPTLLVHFGWARVPMPPGDIVRQEYRGLTIVEDRNLTAEAEEVARTMP